jgi:hypothetical protein
MRRLFPSASSALLLVVMPPVVSCGTRISVPISPSACPDGTAAAGDASAHEIAARVRLAHTFRERTTVAFVQTIRPPEQLTLVEARGTAVFQADNAEWNYDNGNRVVCESDAVRVFDEHGTPLVTQAPETSDFGILSSFMRDGGVRIGAREVQASETMCARTNIVLASESRARQGECRTAFFFLDAKTYRIKSIVMVGGFGINRIELLW